VVNITRSPKRDVGGDALWGPKVSFLQYILLRVSDMPFPARPNVGLLGWVPCQDRHGAALLAKWVCD